MCTGYTDGSRVTEAAADVLIRVNPAHPSVMQNDVFVIHIKVAAGSQPVDGAEVRVDFNPVHLQVVDAGGNPASIIESGEPALTFVSTSLQDELGLLGSDCVSQAWCVGRA